MNSSIDTQHLVTVAIELAKEAGQLILTGKREGFETQNKAGTELVTSCDLAAEKLLTEAIRQSFPDHTIIGEEGTGSIDDPDIPNDKNTPTWFIDPIDGTANFAHGLPWYAVSIGVEVEGAACCGVIHAPELDYTFSASVGTGAYLNGRPISVAKATGLSESLVATGFSYDRVRNVGYPVDALRAVLSQAKDVRRMGVASLDCAMVAAGWISAYWEQGLQPWDVSAGALLVREAGGLVTDFDGYPFRTGGLEFVASNGMVHADLLTALNGPR